MNIFYMVKLTNISKFPEFLQTFKSKLLNDIIKFYTGQLILEFIINLYHSKSIPTSGIKIIVIIFLVNIPTP